MGKGINVLSLFDGKSCGQLALERKGIKVNKYFASEIDKPAQIVSKANYPNTIYLGDVRNIKTEDLPKIDMLIGGSPCQSFSFAGKQNGMSTTDNIKITTLAQYLKLKEEKFEFEGQSYLFWEYIRILKAVKPQYFLLENVLMAKHWETIISRTLGINPIMINSALVSAQNRKRLYWTNISTVKEGMFGDVVCGISQPKDRRILLKDILEDGSNKVGRITGRYLVDGKRQDGKMKTAGLTTQRIEPRLDNKSGTITTVGKDNVVLKPQKLYNVNPSGNGMNGWVYDIETKSPTLTTNKGEGIKIRDKSKCVRSSGRGSFDRHEWDWISDCHFRKLTPLECERLQTLPDGYTDYVSNSQRYKMIGNGWTIEVIAHILGHLPKRFITQ